MRILFLQLQERSLVVPIQRIKVNWMSVFLMKIKTCTVCTIHIHSLVLGKNHEDIYDKIIVPTYLYSICLCVRSMEKGSWNLLSVSSNAWQIYCDIGLYTSEQLIHLLCCIYFVTFFKYGDNYLKPCFEIEKQSQEKCVFIKG